MRPTRDELLNMTAFMWAKRGTCDRLQVGCVISRGGRILVQGYNGAPAGLPHCIHTELDRQCNEAVHAEQSAIAWAARNGVKLEGAEMHVTNMPCVSCSMSIINAGIARVMYTLPYRIKDGVELLRRAGVEVEWNEEGEEPSIIRGRLED